MKKWIIGVVFAVILVLVGLFVFSQLGGFNEIELEMLSPVDLKINGVYYKGTPQDEGLVNAFEKVSRIAKDSNLPLYTIYYVEPAGKLDTMEVFVGVDIDTKIPDFEEREFHGEKGVLAKINAHRFVMPGPSKVKKQIVDFANQAGELSPTVFIDKILSSEEVHVIGIIEK
ncbi:hypothetical protein MM213_14935 [Belliella sp. R4-6]|uniref:GyrI-like small molecule binding domain-containing protein n=1 Tax=Belliella alkalica TaxID=1730871 RepID=A0ABS9VEC7_9BACT|nr:hypothetical protein [Belliella alkalica]MCH7414794.1 hypothetical protein [Belliella alkalica]